MRSINQRAGSAMIGLATLVAGAAMTPPARAEFIIDITQSGSNVVANGSGTFNTTDIGNTGGGGGYTFLEGSTGQLALGPGTIFAGLGVNDWFTWDVSGPTSFGPGNAFELAKSGSGEVVYIQGVNGQQIGVQNGYVSGTYVTDSATWNSTTISGLGLTTGIYTWTWGSGQNADSLILDIGGTYSAAAPEPASLALVGAALAGLGALRRRRRVPVARP
jgi:hypothetical protein